MNPPIRTIFVRALLLTALAVAAATASANVPAFEASSKGDGVLIADTGKEVGVSSLLLPFRPIVGVKTSLLDKDCVFTDSDEWDTEPAIDHFEMECAGLGGYQIIQYGGDARSYLSLQKGEARFDFEDVINKAGQFPYVSGSDIEWRVQVDPKARRAKPFAFIFEVSGSDPESFTLKSQLVVVRIEGEKACLIDTVPSAAEGKAREAARRLADDKAEVSICP